MIPGYRVSLWALVGGFVLTEECPMRGPKATPIALTERQRTLLERLARRHTSPQR